MKIEIDELMGTATFSVNLESEASKETFKGMFRVKCILSPLQYIYSDSLYRELLGKTSPQLANDYVNSLCYALAQLKFRLISSPSWFEGDNSEIKGSGVEDNILLHILEKAVEAESDYRKLMEEKYDKAKEVVKGAIDSGEIEEELDDLEDE